VRLLSKKIVFRSMHGAPFIGLRRSRRTQKGAYIQGFVNELARAGLNFKLWFEDKDDYRNRLFVAPDMLELVSK
jgi:hypothetical protein